MNNVHTLRNYDDEERYGALRQGFPTELTKEEYNYLMEETLRTFEIIHERDNSIIVKETHEKSDWENMFN